VPENCVPFCLYVLMNPDNTTYVGQTSDLKARLAEHNDPECALTLHTNRRRAAAASRHLHPVMGIACLLQAKGLSWETARGELPTLSGRSTESVPGGPVPCSRQTDRMC